MKVTNCNKKKIGLDKKNFYSEPTKWSTAKQKTI